MTFYGRSRELRSLLDEYEAGTARVVLLEGDAGIGKTTLVDQFLSGVDPPRVLFATGDESMREVSFGVLDQLLPVRMAGTPEGVSQLILASHALQETVVGARTVIIVDDAHWADELSLRTVLFALRQSLHAQTLVLLCVRTGEADRLPEGLVKLASGRTGTRLRLASLTASDLRAIAASRGVSLSLADAERLHTHSDGNPLYARALLDELPPAAWARDALLPAPQHFAALTVSKLDSLPPGAVRVLEAASVLGDDAAADLVARLAEVVDFLPMLDAAVAGDLIALASDASLRFRHPLTRAAVYHHMLPGRRAQLHAAAAAALQDEWSSLRHRVAAALGPDPELIDDLEAFAAACSRGRRWRTAVAALVAASRLGVEPGRREQLLLDAIEAATYAGDGPRARELVAELGDPAPHPQLDCALVYVTIGQDRADETRLRLRRAWEACDHERAPELAARIAERMAFVGVLDRRPDAAILWATRSFELGGEDPNFRSRASWQLAQGLHDAGRREEAYAVLGALPATTGIHATLLLADDRIEDARALLTPATSQPTLPNLVAGARTLATHARVEFLAGDWTTSAQLVRRAVLYASESDQMAALGKTHAIGLELALATGAADDAQTHHEALAALRPVFAAHVVEIHAALAYMPADPAAMLEALAPVERLERETPGVVLSDRTPWEHLFARALIELGRLDDAEAFIAARSSELRSGFARSRLAAARAALEAARGEEERADAAFAEAKALLPEVLVYEHALLDHAHGAMLRRAGRRRAAATKLSAANRVFVALGATPMRTRTERELAACGLTPQRRAPSARLTPREQSIAALAARGMSNGQLALELGISRRTVELHMSRIYRKLGVKSRAELVE